MSSNGDFLNLENRPKRRYYNRPRVVFEYRNNIAVPLPPDVEDRFSLIAGLDLAHFAIDGNKVIITFERRGGAFSE